MSVGIGEDGMKIPPASDSIINMLLERDVGVFLILNIPLLDNYKETVR